ncbi:MAG: sulfotransferase domain-containing protein [Pseudomonadota bacterium]
MTAKIKTWENFNRRIRHIGVNLLRELGKYENSIFVAGCQRSGTTAVTNALNLSSDFGKYKFTRDTELDAALILSGFHEVAKGRYCFQTTYLNEQFTEYFAHSNFKLVWVLRRPVPVVRSMLHNWSLSSLDRLYEGVGKRYLEDVGGPKPKLFGDDSVSHLQKACASYIAKVSQTQILLSKLGKERMLIVDYDDLLSEDGPVILANLYEFADVSYDASYLEYFGKRTTRPNTKKLNQSDERFVQSTCEPTYSKATSITDYACQ